MSTIYEELLHEAATIDDTEFDDEDLESDNDEAAEGDCCPNLESCPYFDSNKCSPEDQNAIQDQYCNGDFSQCARFLLSQCADVPNDLAPTDTTRAEKIMSNLSLADIEEFLPDDDEE